MAVDAAGAIGGRVPEPLVVGDRIAHLEVFERSLLRQFEFQLPGFLLHLVSYGSASVEKDDVIAFGEGIGKGVVETKHRVVVGVQILAP